MKKTLSLLLFLIFAMSTSFGQDQFTQTEFENLCDSTGLKFTMPEGYTLIDVKKNRDLYYSFAIINQDSTMEIRYTLQPLIAMLKDYEASLKDSNTIMLNPNVLYKSTIYANVLNMTGGQMYDIGAFPSQAVKREFNADAGGSCFFEFNCEFGEGYKYGQFIYLHTDNIADVLVTFMSNNIETHADLMQIGFHSLVFK